MALDFSDDRPPLPPLDLIQRVVNPFKLEDAATVRDGFDVYPQTQLRALERSLALVGKEFCDFDRLLDFGCGPGRYLRHLGSLASTTEIHGADIDEESIGWLRRNVPFGRFSQIPAVPPTGYDDEFFDFVINHSVFTHIDAEMQDSWLAELHRITRPGAVLLLTVHCLAQWNQALLEMKGTEEDADRIRTKLERDGIVFIRDDHLIGSTHPDSYHSTFHAPWYIFEHWTRWFELVAYVPMGSHSQDLVVLTRPSNGSERPGAIGHAADAGAATRNSRDVDGWPPRLQAQLETLASRVAARAHPASRAARLRRRIRPREAGRQAEIDTDIVDVLRDLLDDVDAQRRSLNARNREISMLRVGMYEQGERISIITQQLREEFGDQRS